MVNGKIAPFLVHKKTLIILLALFIFIIFSYFILFHVTERKQASEDDTSSIHYHSDVIITPVQSGPLKAWIFSEGHIHALRKEFIQFQRAGRVTTLGTDETGKTLREGVRVKGPTEHSEGQFLAQLDDEDQLIQLQQAQAKLNMISHQLTLHQNQLSHAYKEHQRHQLLWEKRLISLTEKDQSHMTYQVALAQVNATKSELAMQKEAINEQLLAIKKHTIRAPFDGVIAKFNLKLGDQFSEAIQETQQMSLESRAAVVLVDDSIFEVTLNIPVKQAQKIKEGAAVFLATNDHEIEQAIRLADNQAIMQGFVWSISPIVSTITRSVTIKILVINEHLTLVDGSLMIVWITAFDEPNVLKIPVESITKRSNETFVFVFDPSANRVEKRPIITGIQGLDDIEIIAGLQERESIILQGQHRLHDGMLVNAINHMVEEHAASKSRKDG